MSTRGNEEGTLLYDGNNLFVDKAAEHDSILLFWKCVWREKWDGTPRRCDGNSMRGFAAPGAHLSLSQSPRRHPVKLDCRKRRHAVVDQMK